MLQLDSGEKRSVTAISTPLGEAICRWVCGLLIAGLVFGAASASAFSRWVITELYSNEDGSVQFVELFTEANGQDGLTGQNLVALDEEGAVINTYTFSEDSPSPTTGRTLLIGTESLISVGGVTPDFFLPENFLSLNGGAVDFAGIFTFDYDGFPDDPGDSVQGSGVFRASPRNFAGAFGFIPGFDADVLLLSSLLPTSRSVEVGTTATVFATLVNAGTDTASDCAIAIDGSVAADFQHQTTNPETNGLAGSPNQPVDIAANGSQSFVLSLTPSASFDATTVAFDFGCGNAAAAPVFVGLNTLSLSASTSPAPDIVTLAATPSGDGITNIDGPTATGVFAAATVNLGSTANLTVTANTGTASLPLTLTLCETNPATAACINPATPAASVNTSIGASGQPTFSVFATAAGDVPFDPAANRVFIEFADDNGAIRGSASVAVRTLAQ